MAGTPLIVPHTTPICGKAYQNMKSYRFTENWFAHTATWWGSFFSSYRWPRYEQRTILEIGSFEGRSTVWILENLVRHRGDSVVCIDPFTGSPEHAAHQTEDLFDRFRWNIGETGKQAHVRVLRTLSHDGLPRLLTEGYRCDFAYVDGSHRAADVLLDLCLTWGLLNLGGVCICDDFLWQPPAGGGPLAAPKIAIDAFTTVFSDQIKVVRAPQNYQVAFVKCR